VGASFAVIAGGQIDLSGFHRAAVVTAVLLGVGALVSWVGIRAVIEPVLPDQDDAYG